MAQVLDRCDIGRHFSYCQRERENAIMFDYGDTNLKRLRFTANMPGHYQV